MIISDHNCKGNIIYDSILFYHKLSYLIIYDNIVMIRKYHKTVRYDLCMIMSNSATYDHEQFCDLRSDMIYV